MLQNASYIPQLDTERLYNTQADGSTGELHMWGLQYTTCCAAADVTVEHIRMSLCSALSSHCGLVSACVLQWDSTTPSLRAPTTAFVPLIYQQIAADLAVPGIKAAARGFSWVALLQMHWLQQQQQQLT